MNSSERAVPSRNRARHRVIFYLARKQKRRRRKAQLKLEPTQDVLFVPIVSLFTVGREECARAEKGKLMSDGGRP